MTDINELNWLDKLDEIDFKELIDELKEVTTIEEFRGIYHDWKHSFTEDLPIPTDNVEEENVELTKPKVSAKISFYHSQNINLIPDNSKEKLCTMVINNRTQACIIDFEESRLGEVVLINEKYVTLKEGSFNWSNL